MKSISFTSLMACCVFALALPLPAQQQSDPQPEMEFRVEPSVGAVVIGDRVPVLLKSTPPHHSDQILGIEFLPEPETWHEAEPWSPPSMRKSGDKSAWSATLQPFETGLVPLPKARVTYRLADGTMAEAQSTTTTLTVKTAMQSAIASEPGQPEEVPGLIGPKPIYGFPRDWRGVALAAAGALAALVLAYLLYRKLRARPKVVPAKPAEPPLAPGPWALKEIEIRRRLPVAESGPAKEIASLASEVVRIYITRRFDFLALDRTSHECLETLNRLGLDSSSHALLRRFFADCDFAKFTYHDLQRERWTTLWDDARQFVLATSPSSEFESPAATRPRPQPAEATAR
jgi:hypothetical protein